jgi:acyl-CoA synthetase (AMP-forming)/AMP-acid ligase II
VTYTHRSSFLHTLKLLQADVLAARTTDVILPIVPLFHASAWGLPFAAPAAGSKLVLPGRQTDGASLARLIAAEGVTIAVGVPTVFLGLCEHLDATGARLPSLERIILGGAPTPPALMERSAKPAGRGRPEQLGHDRAVARRRVRHARRSGPASAVSGRPAIGVDLMLADETGAPLAEQRDQEGRLHVRGAAVIERYFGQAQSATTRAAGSTPATWRGSTAKGNLMITGRAKDLIKSGGEWINPAEIEAIVCALPQVSLAAVIGRETDPKWSERPMLLVELREGQEISDQALLGRCVGGGLVVDPRRRRAAAGDATGLDGEDRQAAAKGGARGGVTSPPSLNSCHPGRSEAESRDDTGFGASSGSSTLLPPSPCAAASPPADPGSRPRSRDPPARPPSSAARPRRSAGSSRR